MTGKAFRSGYRVLAVLPLETEGDSSADSALGRGVAQTVSARIGQGGNGRECSS